MPCSPSILSDTPVGYITPHTWDDAQRAWNDGRMDQWLPAKGRLGMGAYGPAELPFQTALADAFTLCEAYHCSMQAGTNPNSAVPVDRRQRSARRGRRPGPGQHP